MFDITSWIRETIFRRPRLLPVVAGEELSEKKTTKMGYFLLVCMFLAMLSTAQWSLSIIKDIPDRPTSAPGCVSDVLSAFSQSNPEYTYSRYSRYDYYGYSSSYDRCNLVSQSNPVYDYTIVYNAIRPQYDTLISYQQQIRDLESQKRSMQSYYQNERDDYNTALLEETAGIQNRAYSVSESQKSINQNKEKITKIDTQIGDIQSRIDLLIASSRQQVSALDTYHSEASRLYTRAYIWFKIVQTTLLLLFTGTVFGLLYRFYLRHKLSNSPHTIIFSVATFAYGLILLQLFLVFLWDVIPHEIFDFLLGWISLFTPLVFLVQFLWPVFVVGIFGFLVYRIQKRLYSPSNVLKRFVTDKKCPNCGNAVDMNKPFCPLCSHEIHIHCPHCHELTMKGMPYCSNCGTELPKQTNITSDTTK